MRQAKCSEEARNPASKATGNVKSWLRTRDEQHVDVGSGGWTYLARATLRADFEVDAAVIGASKVEYKSARSSSLFACGFLGVLHTEVATDRTRMRILSIPNNAYYKLHLMDGLF